MTGCYRRAIRLRADPGRAVAEVEDDFHHFAVTIEHDGTRVTDARGQAIRYPWSSCPLAAGALPALAGLPLAAHPTAIYRHTDPLLQCTHMFEMAGLAVAQAARGLGARRYDAWVSDPVEGRVAAELRCDGAVVLAWTLRDGLIAKPDEQRGKAPMALRSTLLANEPPEAAEALLIMRRAVSLATARSRDVDAYANAGEMDHGAACFVFRPGVAEHALRRRGSVRDFSIHPGPLADAAPFGETP